MKYLAVILIIICPYSLFGQFNIFEKPDSIFKYFKAPIVEKAIYDRLVKDDAVLNIGCYLQTDTSGRIASKSFFPFLGIGNDYKIEDSIWHSVSKSIDTASDTWLLKPSLWNIDEIDKNPIQRPFTGRPRYFIIFEVSGIQISSIDKISFIKDFLIK